jgi:hypothetical protein
MTVTIGRRELLAALVGAATWRASSRMSAQILDTAGLRHAVAGANTAAKPNALRDAASARFFVPYE